MTFEQFNKFQLELFDDCLKIRDTKGKEYANSEDRFANFKRDAKELGITPELDAVIFLRKHLNSIFQAIRTQQYEGRAEPIRGRFVDAIVYLTLIAGMIEEKAVKDFPERDKKETTKIVANNLDGSRCNLCNQPFLLGQSVWYTDPFYYHTVCPNEEISAKPMEKA